MKSDHSVRRYRFTDRGILSTGPPDPDFNRANRLTARGRAAGRRFAPLALMCWLAAVFELAGAIPAASEPQQGWKLVGSGTEGPAYQGWSAALSGDGNTALIGGAVDNKLRGAVWVFIRHRAEWAQQGTKLVGSGAVGGAGQGISVALSHDGNTAIVGGPFDNRDTGAAWVYTRGNGVWTQQGGKLIGSGAIGDARQGSSVALSGDGTTAIVGGAEDNSYSGAAWVFTRSGDVWTQQGKKLVGSGAVGHAGLGVSVALSGDGNTAIVGGVADNSYSGAAWIFTRSGGVWTQQGNKLVGNGADGKAGQGVSVGLSGDGNIAIVGGVGDNSDTGAAWVFARSGGVWTQQGGKLIGSGAVGNALQGHSVALSGDGNTAILGGIGDNSYTGAAWAFTRSSGGSWSQQGSKLVGTGAIGKARQGSSVALSGDGDTALVGAVVDNIMTGAAWAHTRSGGEWTHPQFLGY